MSHGARAHLSVLLLPLILAGCYESSGRDEVATAQSCMKCHNGSQANDYSGPGIENPHPFTGAANIQCTTCHGGNGQGNDELTSHVPPPPEIGDRNHRTVNPRAFFNRLTLAGIDKFPDYVVDGQTYTALDYLQFINPGDLRVVKNSKGCGQCHAPHAESVNSSPLATQMGIFSGATYAIGLENAIPENQGLFEDTAADLAFRAVQDQNFVLDPAKVGVIGRLIEAPVFSVFGDRSPTAIFNNTQYDALTLHTDLNPDNSVKADSRLGRLYQEQVAFTCGDCHLGSAGANNRYGDYRSSGCTACHMPYSLDGRSRSQDPNVPKDEPLDPDDIDEPERSHVRAHRVASIAKTLPSGQRIEGIDDHTCAGCHQGSNRTVMQYWGIRLDQNADLRNRVQYPANPVTFRNTAQDTRLFDPAVGNRTFNGRNANQYILHEDYDGDGRDDTPPDVHYEAGLGCIDCHGSFDLHGGDVNDPKIVSRMEHGVAIQCESCHGGTAAYAPTKQGVTYGGQTAELAMDAKGNVLKHVVKEASGHYFLTSRLTGNRHFVPQTLDVIVDNDKRHPTTLQPLYSAKASYAMGRADGNPATGIGPQQTGAPLDGFSHGDSMSCVSCHASWTNTCMGCHLGGEYDTGNNFSNITGERIVFRQANADFTYQSPLFFQLGVGSDNMIKPFSANTKVFWRYEDYKNDLSPVFSFSDRNGGGRNPATSFPSLSHNAMMPHSIRGKVSPTNEGPRYCVACHLTTKAINDFGPQYDAFRTAMANNDFGALDFPLLKTHFGLNTGNQLNSPFFVHAVAGLGSGMFLFNQYGAAMNPLDTNDNRVGSEGVSPADSFNPGNVALNLDTIVSSSGASNGSSNHAMLDPAQTTNRRDGATDPRMAGPLGAILVRRLTDPSAGILLNSWLDANGGLGGNAANFVR